jgi:hypothetical protein
MSDPHEQALDILQELNFTQEPGSEEETPEPAGKHIQIVSIYHEADKSSMQRLAFHLNVMRRQVAVNEDIHLDYKNYEIWTDYPSDDAQEGLSGANYLIILMSLELITALYNDAELYQALQRSMRNKGAIRDAGTTISIVLMTTKVQWDTNEFPVSAFYPQPQNKALASIRDKNEVYVEIIEQLRQWITQKLW